MASALVASWRLTKQVTKYGQYVNLLGKWPMADHYFWHC